MKITKVYTRTGDGGKTSLVGGERICKDDIRLEAYGTVDELSSHLGLLATLAPDHQADLQRIQSALFRLGGHLSTNQDTTPLYPSCQVPPAETEWLEQQADQMLAQMPAQQGFILPGGTQAAAQCHVCRTVCRRAERRIVALTAVAKVGEEERRYVNRLSDYLFVLARRLNNEAGRQDTPWKDNH